MPVIRGFQRAADSFAATRDGTREHSVTTYEIVPGPGHHLQKDVQQDEGARYVLE
jgi:hypothetical protein